MIDARQLGQQIGDGLNLATRQYHAGSVNEAIRTLDKLEASARAGNHPGLAYVLIQKAGWLRELGRLEEARTVLRDADAVCGRLPPGEAPLGSLRMEQGIVAHQAGDLPTAESILKQAQALAAGSPLEEVMMSDILANLSSVYSDQGRLEEAQTALHEAINYDVKTGDPRALASNLNMLGMIYFQTGDRKTALLYLTKSKDIATEAGLPKETADAISNLATVASMDGAVDTAEAGFVAALEDAGASGRLPDIAAAKSNLGVVAGRQGDFKKSRELLMEAYRIHSDLGLAHESSIDLINLTQTALSLNDPEGARKHVTDARKIVEKHGFVELLWGLHYLAAKTELAGLEAVDVSEAELKSATSEAISHYEKAADAVELLRAGIGRPEERQLLLVGKDMMFAEAMLFAAMMGDRTLAWSFAERARGRAFLELMGAARIGKKAEEHPLAARRSALIQQLTAMKDAGGPEAQAIMDELRLLRSRISAEAPTIAALTESELPRIEDIAAAVPPDTAIIEFFLGPNNLLTAFVLDKRGVAAMHTLDLGPTDLAGTIQQFRAELQYGVEGEPTGELLFDILFVPVWESVASVGRLLIAPHGALHYLPFAALWFKNSGEGPKHLYLCQRFHISILPSASFFRYALNLPGRDAHAKGSVVLGNPTGDLPGSATEAAAVAKLLNASATLGPEAVRSRILEMSGGYRVIHVASHGVYNDKDPLLSGVLLADGLLSVEDIMEARLPGRLLTLSGCLTGISAQAPGDELTGLSRAALAAGISSVITTLWEVQDDASAVFFQRFYTNLRDGMEKDEALGAAQRSLLAGKKYSSPMNWAPYILLGDYR